MNPIVQNRVPSSLLIHLYGLNQVRHIQLKHLPFLYPENIQIFPNLKHEVHKHITVHSHSTEQKYNHLTPQCDTLARTNISPFLPHSDLCNMYVWTWVVSCILLLKLLFDHVYYVHPPYKMSSTSPHASMKSTITDGSEERPVRIM